MISGNAESYPMQLKSALEVMAPTPCWDSYNVSACHQSVLKSFRSERPDECLSPKCILNHTCTT